VSEKAEILRDGAKAQKNSGRGKIQKGDAQIGPFTYDIKEYPKSFTINQTFWSKVCTDAFKSGNTEPALKIVMGDVNKVRLWVISDDMFHEMLDAWMEKNGNS
jgi:hypothetical protein